MPPGIARIRSSMGRASYRICLTSGSGALAKVPGPVAKPVFAHRPALDRARPRARRPDSGVRVEQRTIRPRIADVAREAGVSKTAVSFAFNSPDRLSPETASRIREVAEQLGLPAPPGGPDAQPAPDADASACSPRRRSRSSSPTRSSARSPRASRSRPRSPAMRSISSRRCTGRWPGDRPGDGRRHRRDRPGRRHPEVEAIRRAGVPIVLVDSTRAAATTARSRSTTSAAPEPRREHLLGAWPPRHPRHRRRAADSRPAVPTPRASRSRRLRGYREAFADGRRRDLRDRVVVGPASIDGGIAAARPGVWTTACARRPSWR